MSGKKVPADEARRDTMTSCAMEWKGCAAVVEIVFEEARKRTAAYDGEACVGLCAYAEDGAVWTAYHTEVEPAYGGQGIAARLVDELVRAARGRGVKIVPACSYVLRQF